MTNMPYQSSERAVYDQKYTTGRHNLLLVVGLTVINLILLVTNSDRYFLFSAYIPYYITAMGMLLCGRFPAEYYTGELAGISFLDDTFFFITFAIATALTLIYMLAWAMSGKHRVGWLIFALVFFGLDTAAMLLLNGISTGGIFDLLIHGWVIYELVVGIKAHYTLKKLPAENPFAPTEAGEDADEPAPLEDSPILRPAEKDVKHRVFLEIRYYNLTICYRRVKRTNELVINGNVYGEYEALMERPHTLEAVVDGHHVAVGTAGNSRCFIAVDGELLAKKMRWF